MARFSRCGLVRKSISVLSLLAIVFILAVPVALLVLLLIFIFKTSATVQAPSLKTGGQLGSVFSLAWQEPFTYEAKVYASLCSVIPSDKDLFFKSAQLLWHIEPQSIVKKYPVFRKKVSVHIPSQLRLTPSLNQILYAHMFIQKAGLFSPHPDFSDPHLISSKVPLVQWSSRSSNLENAKSVSAPNKENTPKLIGQNSAAWAIILENNEFSSGDIPSYLQVTYDSSKAGTYNPPLLPNTFTKGLPKGQLLPVLKNKPLAADIYQHDIEVELELLGIRQGWALLKTRFLDYASTWNPALAQNATQGHSSYKQDKTYTRTEWAHPDDQVFSRAAEHISVPFAMFVVVWIALFSARLPAFIRLLFRLLSTPAARWIGLSRATIAIILSAQALGALSSIASHRILGVLGLVFAPSLITTAYIATQLDDMTFAPWVGLSQLCCQVFGRKALPKTGGSLSAEQLTFVVGDRTEPDLTETSTITNPYFTRPEPIVAIRRGIDRVALRWVHLLGLPLIAIVALYGLVLQDKKLLSLGFIASTSRLGSRAFFFVAWLPQVIVNYKIKSGSLTPVTLNSLLLGSSVLNALFDYMFGHGTAIDVALCIPANAGHFIIVLQRIMYFRKPKQE